MMKMGQSIFNKYFLMLLLFPVWFSISIPAFGADDDAKLSPPPETMIQIETPQANLLTRCLRPIVRASTWPVRTWKGRIVTSIGLVAAFELWPRGTDHGREAPAWRHYIEIRDNVSLKPSNEEQMNSLAQYDAASPEEKRKMLRAMNAEPEEKPREKLEGQPKEQFEVKK